MSPFNPPIQWDQRLFNWGQGGRSAKLYTHLHVLPKIDKEELNLPSPACFHGVCTENFAFIRRLYKVLQIPTYCTIYYLIKHTLKYILLIH